MAVAVKVLDLQGDDSQAADLKREINILQSCQCPQIVAYGGAFVKDGQLWISMEYCGAGSLSDLMAICDTTLGEREIAAVMFQSLLGLQYLHKTKKIHRDIKSGNILLTDDGICKLADFGVSAELSTTMAKAKTMIGTPYFMAPEVLMNTDYDSKADVWSLGITAYELAVGQPPLADVHPMRAIFQIPNSPPPRLPEEGGFSKPFQQFIEACLQKAPADRLSCEKLMALPFFNELRAGNNAILVVRQLLERCKQEIDAWRAMDAEDQAAQNQNTPMGQAIDTGYDDNNSGTVAISPHMLNHSGPSFDGTMRINDVSDARALRSAQEYKSPQPSYNNDGTVLIKKTPQEDMGTVRLTKPPAGGQPNQNPHFGSLKVKPQHSGTVVFNSGTMVARPAANQAPVSAPSNSNLNTLSTQSLVSSLNNKSTKADIEKIKSQVELNRSKDLQQITLFYEQRLRDLETLGRGK